MCNICTIVPEFYRNFITLNSNMVSIKKEYLLTNVKHSDLSITRSNNFRRNFQCKNCWMHISSNSITLTCCLIWFEVTELELGGGMVGSLHVWRSWPPSSCHRATQWCCCCGVAWRHCCCCCCTWRRWANWQAINVESFKLLVVINAARCGAAGGWLRRPTSRPHTSRTLHSTFTSSHVRPHCHHTQIAQLYSTCGAGNLHFTRYSGDIFRVWWTASKTCISSGLCTKKLFKLNYLKK